MEPLQNSSHSSGQKRARQQLSCTFCRAGKLKCSRQQPCDQCIKRSRDSGCSYLAPPPKKGRNRNTKDRIAHLEGLVVQLINQGANGAPPRRPDVPAETYLPQRDRSGTMDDSKIIKESPGSSPGEQSDAAVAFGQMKITNGETSYVGSAHWEAVLNGIEELKASLDEDVHHEDSPPQPEDIVDLNEPPITSQLMINLVAPVTREYLLRSIPPRVVSEKLLWHWFNSTNPELPAIHKPTFLAEYDRLMKNPSDTPTMWLAMYFGILSLGCMIATFSTGSASAAQVTPTLGEPQHYRKLCAEALALADYTKPKKYTIEALLMYCACEHMSANEASLQIWLLLGLLLRVAMRMGYHRDPSLYSSVTPFEGEMRRRIWYIVYIFDVLSSFAVGLPDMIRQVQSDTQPPRNLLDSDFGVDTVELPPARPFTELSPVSYIIVKSKLAKVFARAADISHAVEAPDYADVLALDAELHKVHSEIPPSLRFVSIQTSIIMDPPPTIFARFKLELIYQKTRCVLHRRYLGWSHGDTAEEVSRDACVDAAMKVIGHLETVHLASQEGGQLSSVPFFLSALGVHDFLLAAMVLCLEVNRLTKVPPTDTCLHRGKILEMWELLETTYRVYRQPARQFTPPEKAVKALEVMLSRVRDLAFEEGSEQPTDKGRAAVVSPAVSGNPEDTSTGLYGNVMIIPSWQQDALYEPIGGMFELSQGLDWQSWDKFIQNPPQDPDDVQRGLVLDEQIGRSFNFGFTEQEFQNNDMGVGTTAPEFNE